VARVQRDRRVLNALAGESPAMTMLREFAGGRDSRGRRHLARLLDDAEHRRLSILPLSFTSRTQRTFLSDRTLAPASAGNYSLLSPAGGHELAADTFERLRPRIVFSFGSYVEEFFAFLEISGREVPLPRVWVYMGDSVGPRGRELAERRGCPLFSVYASAEAGAIGFQCEQREGFHLNVDLCAARVADESGATVPAGQIGDIVVSNLENRAMVLLNYRQGDRGVLATRSCPCGRRLPLLERLEGRRSDVIETADGVRLSELEVEGLFRAELRAVSQCQLFQREPGTLGWRLVGRPDADEELVREAILERGRIVFGEATKVTVEFADHLVKSSSGKLMRVTA
jgi:phenylacetate-CoA ligase